MRKAAFFIVMLCSLLVTGGFAPAATAKAAHALIQGSGSSWAANAVNQWIADVRNNGLQVVFTPSGSAQGRKDFANKTVDFAVSDIGFLGTDPATGLQDTNQGRDYAYLPIVAGGTALPYHIMRNGQQVRNLRLSPATILGIFTNKITNWDDDAITRDNNGTKMPDLPIIPVVHSEGSGSTYQFTRFLWKGFRNDWKGFGGDYATEYFPRQGNQVAENGSDSVMNFVASTAANGAIGYDEYSYALNKNYPVAKVRNAAGYYTLPTQYNVAVALTQAQINMDKNSPDYLLQDLDSVYTYGAQQVYPISSYSYGLIPTASKDATMTSAKRQTLADYLYVSICQGQQQMGPIGYSPLPVNLVQAGFAQINKLKSADSSVNLSNESVTTCHNPTFIAGQPQVNCLAKIAPPPPPCDKDGSGPCTGADTSSKPRGVCVNNTSTGNVPGSGGGNHSGSGGSKSTGNHPGGGGTNSQNPAGNPGTAPGAVANPSAAASQGTHVDPVTGQVVGNAGTGNDPALAGNAQPLTASLPDSQSANVNVALGVIAGVLLLGLLFVPPIVARRFRSGAGK